MFAKALFLGVGLAALVNAEPIPQAAATTSYDPAALSSELASLSAQEVAFTSIFGDLPTLPPSVESVLATAVPSTFLDSTATEIGCALITAVPDWYAHLPGDVKSALTSYESALVAWSKEHSAALASLEGTAGSVTYTGSPFVCTNGAAAPAGTGTTTAGKTTGTTPKSTGSAGAAGSPTSSGSVAASTSSKAGAVAPRATGAMAASFAGVVGVLGLMAAL